MQTIYSKIIWHELGLKDYKIHEENVDKTENLILNWIKNNSIEKVKEVLFGLSFISSIDDDGYYDGNFYGLNQRSKDKRYVVDNEPQSDIVLHDTSLLPSILHLAIETKMSSSEFLFIAKILEVYNEKIKKL